MSALGFVLVSLDLAFKLVGVVVSNLVCLGERMVECDTRTVIAETSEVRFWALLFLNDHSHNFNLIVSESHFNLKLVRHHEFVRFNRVVIVWVWGAINIASIRH